MTSFQGCEPVGSLPTSIHQEKIKHVDDFWWLHHRIWRQLIVFRFNCIVLPKNYPTFHQHIWLWHGNERPCNVTSKVWTTIVPTQCSKSKIQDRFHTLWKIERAPPPCRSFIAWTSKSLHQNLKRSKGLLFFFLCVLISSHSMGLLHHLLGRLLLVHLFPTKT